MTKFSKFAIQVYFFTAILIVGTYISFSHNPHGLPWFLAFTAELILGVNVYLRDPGNKLNSSFSLLALAKAVWIMGVFGLYEAPDKFFAHNWGRAFSTGMIFIPPLFYQFILTLTKKENAFRKKLLTLAYLAAVVFLFLDLSGQFAKEFVKTTWKYTPKPELAYELWLLNLALIMSYSFYLLLKSYNAQRSRAERNRLGYVFGAIFGATLYGLFNVAISFGINIYPLGGLASILSSSIIAYAIVKHQLLDIRIIIRKSLVYAILSLIILSGYVAGVGTLTAIAGAAWIARSSYFVHGLAGLIIAILALQLKNRIQQFVDKIFFKDKYNYQTILKDISGDISSSIEPGVIFETIVKKISDVMHISRGYLMLLNDEKNGYEVRYSSNFDLGSLQKLTLGADDEIVKDLESKRKILLVGESFNKPEFIEQQMCLIIPLLNKQRLSGIILFGRKLSEDPFSTEDMELLLTIANQAAISIENARLLLEIRNLEKSLSNSDKLAALGEFALSVGHEIKNPLTSIKTFCQLVARKFQDPNFIEKFIDIVPFEIERLENVLNQLLSFTKSPARARKVFNVESIIDDLLTLMSYEAFKSKVNIIRKYSHSASAIRGAPEQLKQVFMNLFINAIQAMPQGGRLTITTQTVDNFVEISFKDSGYGITEENLNKVFKPFFTTKDNGSGLGLSITKRIIEEHNGTIFATSHTSEGSNFIVRLPIYVNEPAKVYSDSFAE
jgi:two-component system, NtrC family, sensor kinase